MSAAPLCERNLREWKRKELELPAPMILAEFGAWTDSISRRPRQPRCTPGEIDNPQNFAPHGLGRLASTFYERNMKDKNQKRLDTLYSSAKQLPMAGWIGLLFPILLLIAAPLGILYHSWATRFLDDLEAEKIDIDPELKRKENEPNNKEKIEYLRANKKALLQPAILLGVMVAAIIIIMIVATSM